MAHTRVERESAVQSPNDLSEVPGRSTGSRAPDVAPERVIAASRGGFDLVAQGQVGAGVAVALRCSHRCAMAAVNRRVGSGSSRPWSRVLSDGVNVGPQVAQHVWFTSDSPMCLIGHQELRGCVDN